MKTVDKEKGLQGNMILDAEDWAKKKGFKFFYINGVSAGTKRLYEKRGYTSLGGGDNEGYSVYKEC